MKKISYKKELQATFTQLSPYSNCVYIRHLICTPHQSFIAELFLLYRPKPWGKNQTWRKKNDLLHFIPHSRISNMSLAICLNFDLSLKNLNTCPRQNLSLDNQWDSMVRVREVRDSVCVSHTFCDDYDDATIIKVRMGIISSSPKKLGLPCSKCALCTWLPPSFFITCVLV